MKYLYLALILALCSSCDISYSYNRVIENNSSYDIWVLLSPNCSGDSTLIPSNTNWTMDSDQSYGGLSNIYTSCPAWCLDSIGSEIDGHDSLALSFPIDMNANWETTVHKRGCECRLSITDADIN